MTSNGANGANGAPNWRAQPVLELDALVVGGGFGGVYALYQLRNLGLNTKLFEAGKELGGVWNWNRYPGARVDSEFPLYQLSIPEVWKTWTFSERFPDHAELRRYFQHVDKTLDLSKDVSYRSIVVESTYDENEGRWTVRTDEGRVTKCQYLIMATGSSYKRHYPSFPGLHSYKGVLVHSSDFPEGGVDTEGKRVAVVGQGATGVQIVQELAKTNVDLTIYVRTPNLAQPMVQRKITDLENQTSKSFYSHLFQISRKTRSGFPCDTTTKNFSEVSPEEREERMEFLWNLGGFNWSISGYPDVVLDEKTNDATYEFWRKKTLPRMREGYKRDIFVPVEKPHPIRTKRPSLEQDYYECLDRDNVSVVNMKETPIDHFTETGIVTSDGNLKEFDVIMLATGYDSFTGSMTNMGLKGKDGIDLRDRWKDGVFTWLGMTVPSNPNMFMVYSPQGESSASRGEWKHGIVIKKHNAHQFLCSSDCFVKRTAHYRVPSRLDHRCH